MLLLTQLLDEIRKYLFVLLQTRLLGSQEVEAYVVADSVTRKYHVCPGPVTRQGEEVEA